MLRTPHGGLRRSLSAVCRGYCAPASGYRPHRGLGGGLSALWRCHGQWSLHGGEQLAVKVRGRKYLRIIYGPEYTAKKHMERLKGRNLGRKRSLALREFALGIESLERFVRKEPLRHVHECVFGVLALESEPVDPRLWAVSTKYFTFFKISSYLICLNQLHKSTSYSFGRYKRHPNISKLFNVLICLSSA